MATSPSSLYSGYGAGLPSWVPVLPSNDTYGNTGSWMKSINQNLGTATSAIQSASVARVASLTGYQNLDSASQRAIAAKTATIDLGDSVPYSVPRCGGDRERRRTPSAARPHH